MASKSEKMYSKSPTIGKDEKGKAVIKKKEAKKEDKKDGATVEIRHAHERRGMHMRHEREHMELNHKHEAEHAAHDVAKGGDKKELHKKHAEEKKEMDARHLAEIKKLHKKHEEAPAQADDDEADEQTPDNEQAEGEE